jgi:WD40-like Beta Propeller Repeat
MRTTPAGWRPPDMSRPGRLLELPARRLRRLTSSPAADLSPTWAPDGGRLAHPGGDSEEQEPASMPCTGACP